MTGTILVYRDDGERPSAEVRLAGGDLVRVTLDAGGVVIDTFGPDGNRRVLFRGDADTVARICAAITPAAGFRTTPLDRLLGILIRIGTADDLEAAFAAAAAAIH